jgi:hypothetical protein
MGWVVDGSDSRCCPLMKFDISNAEPSGFGTNVVIKCIVLKNMDLEETEARNDCAGEAQQQSNRPTDR